MTNAELIYSLRYCFEKRKTVVGVPWYVWCDRAADALEAAEKRIDGLLKLVDINTERCEALRKQLREAHESYEKHINELEAQLPKDGEWIEVLDWLQIPQEERGTYRCSACGQVMKYPWSYCPNCGAKMDGERKDGDADGRTD